MKRNDQRSISLELSDTDDYSTVREKRKKSQNEQKEEENKRNDAQRPPSAPPAISAPSAVTAEAQASALSAPELRNYFASIEQQDSLPASNSSSGVNGVNTLSGVSSLLTSYSAEISIPSSISTELSNSINSSETVNSPGNRYQTDTDSGSGNLPNDSSNKSVLSPDNSGSDNMLNGGVASFSLQSQNDRSSGIYDMSIEDSLSPSKNSSADIRNANLKMNGKRTHTHTKSGSGEPRKVEPNADPTMSCNQTQTDKPSGSGKTTNNVPTEDSTVCSDCTQTDTVDDDPEDDDTTNTSSSGAVTIGYIEFGSECSDTIEKSSSADTVEEMSIDCTAGGSALSAETQLGDDTDDGDNTLYGMTNEEFPHDSAGNANVDDFYADLDNDENGSPYHVVDNPDQSSD